jgi:hypothetical protein
VSEKAQKAIGPTHNIMPTQASNGADGRSASLRYKENISIAPAFERHQ